MNNFIDRLNPLITPPLEKSPMMTLTLQEVLIVGSCSEQVKFSELTLDMFRMLQTLEREPQEDMAQMYDQSPAPGRVPFVSNFLLRKYFCIYTNVSRFNILKGMVDVLTKLLSESRDELADTAIESSAWNAR